MNATHRCKVCRSTWVRHADGSWSLVMGTVASTFPNGSAGVCCDNQPMGDQIEALVAPRACDRVGCDQPGSNRPRLMCRSKLAPEHPCPVTLSLVICDKHRAESTVDNFMTDAGWAKLAEGFDHANLARPDRELLTLEWDQATAENEPRKAFANAMQPKPARNPFRRS